MSKSVISLVKELGVKSTNEVLALLRQAGVDVDAEGFGVMSKVDDSIVARLQGGRPAEEKPAAKRPAPPKTEAPAEAAPARAKRPPVDEATSAAAAAAPARQAAPRKDFFGVKTAPAAPPPAAAEPAAAGSTPARPQAAPGGQGQPQRRPLEAQANAQRPAAPGAAQAQQGEAPRRPARPDLSSGPRIISMPDPQEAARLRAQRDGASRPPVGGGGSGPMRRPGGPPPAAAPAPGAGSRGKPGDKRREAEAAAGGKRRRLKSIGGQADDDKVRSRKRVFKVANQRMDSGNAVVPVIKITGQMQLRDVASETGVKVSDIVRFLMRELGISANINHLASVEEIEMIAAHFGIQATVALNQEPESELLQFEEVVAERQVARPPVVTIMGHVDHGKTKLLDTIRTTNVVAGESGGITQHIGAYQVEKKGKHITFIDTPGHEAFTAMRARGSQVTDIVILVVAADDGVMPQTVEAINHAKAAKVPIIVAINKMDKHDANPDKVKQQLMTYELIAEEYGGDTVFVPVSALKAQGIDELLDMILLTAELVDPKGDPTAPPFGVVIESQVDPGIGVVATVLVRQGTLKKGQFILSGTSVGRIKRMENEWGKEVESAGPSTPVRIIGFSEPPENGDKIFCFQNKKQAQAISDQRIGEARSRAAASASGRISLETYRTRLTEGKTTDLNLIIKADVGGSAEALVESLKKIEVETIRCNVIASGVGQVNDSDVDLATASNAVIIGFHTGITNSAKRLAEREKVDIRLYDIIYKVTEDIELAMKGLLAPVFEEKALGRVEVRAIFKQEKGSTISGGYVLEGIARRGAKYRLRRAKEIVQENKTLDSLRRFKDDVREVASGFECGFVLDGTDVQEGDILELYEVVQVKRT
jgi:translation initiation factor IF-2